MEIAYSDLNNKTDYDSRTRKSLDLVEPPITLTETHRYEDIRSKHQIVFEEQIRDLFNEEISPENLKTAMEKICYFGEKYWQKVDEEDGRNYPEIKGRLVADIRADYERAKLTFEGNGSYPRQVARIVSEIITMAPKLIEDNYQNLVSRRIMVNYGTGQVSKIKFRNSESERNFKESQADDKQMRLRRVDELKDLVLEQYPEVGEYLEGTKK